MSQSAVISNTAGSPKQTYQSVLVAIAFTTVTIIALSALNKLLPRFYWVPDSWKVYVPFAGAAAGAIVFYNFRYGEMSRLLALALRSAALGIVIDLIAESPDFTLANPDTATTAANYVNQCYWLAIVAAFLGLVRPSLIVPAAIYIISTRHLVYGISGLEMSTLDIRYMIDMALYLSIGAIATVRVCPYVHASLDAPERQDEIVGAGFGLHLANYFWSGIAKITIGSNPLYWILHNATQNQIPYTIEGGILPIGHVPWLADVAYKFLSVMVVPINAAIVTVQVFAIFCILRVSWLKITSFLYDCLHVGIYLFGGLFFWPWIWNNLTIWWAARSNPGEFSIPLKVACITAIVLGYPSLNLIPAAWLAWFDVADARQVYFEAVTADGRAIKVPSAFFLSHSYSVSHAYMGTRSDRKHYDYTMLASAETIERNEWSGSCPDPRILPKAAAEETDQQRNERQALISRFLKAHHAKMLEREASRGLGNYYFHLHHHPSNPFLYGEFNNLSLKNVVGYNLVLESVCHRLVGGRVEKKTWAKDAEYFDVR